MIGGIFIWSRHWWKTCGICHLCTVCPLSSAWCWAFSSGNNGEGLWVTVNRCNNLTALEIHVLFPSQKAQFIGPQAVLPGNKRSFHPLPSVTISLYHLYKFPRIIPEGSDKVCRTYFPDIQLSHLGSHALNINPSGSLFLRTLKCDTPAGSSLGEGPLCGGGPFRRWTRKPRVPCWWKIHKSRTHHNFQVFLKHL